MFESPREWPMFDSQGASAQAERHFVTAALARGDSPAAVYRDGVEQFDETRLARALNTYPSMEVRRALGSGPTTLFYNLLAMCGLLAVLSILGAAVDGPTSGSGAWGFGSLLWFFALYYGLRDYLPYGHRGAIRSVVWITRLWAFCNLVLVALAAAFSWEASILYALLVAWLIWIHVKASALLRAWPVRDFEDPLRDIRSGGRDPG